VSKYVYHGGFLCTRRDFVPGSPATHETKGLNLFHISHAFTTEIPTNFLKLTKPPLVCFPCVFETQWPLTLGVVLVYVVEVTPKSGVNVPLLQTC
jgi:hypothetical protein